MDRRSSVKSNGDHATSLTTWRTWIALVTPVLLSPLLWSQGSTQEWKCAFVVLLMAVFWSTEPLPVAITALFPVFLLPIFGLVTTDEACKPYLQEPNMVFVGSLIFAVAVEQSGLHRRCALLILKTVGGNFDTLILGFMLTTMAIAMWIINTAAAAMMLPIADALLAEVFPSHDSALGDEFGGDISSSHGVSVEMTTYDTNQNTLDKQAVCNNSVKGTHEVQPDESEHQEDEIKKAHEIRHLKKIFYLSIAYSANIGGTSTLTSNGPNLILRFVLDNKFKGNAPLDYTSWFLFNAPAVIATIIVVWFAFKLVYFNRVSVSSPASLGQSVIKKKYKDLGAVRFSEYTVMTLFVLLVSLWMLRDPTFMRGWAHLFPAGKPRDATAVIFVITLLFFIPLEPRKNGFRVPILNWPHVQSKIPWGVVLLRGGGYSLALAVNKSGLSQLIADRLLQFNFLNATFFVIVISFVTAFVTEFASNSAVASVLLPIACDLAIRLHVNPLILLIPITLSCSYAFILPVGTPANALVFDHAKLQTKDMLAPGLLTQTIALFVMLANLYTMGSIIFDINKFPTWIPPDTPAVPA